MDVEVGIAEIDGEQRNAVGNLSQHAASEESTVITPIHVGEIR